MVRPLSALIGPALALTVLTVPASGQTPPPPQTVELFPQDPGSAVVEALQVVARPPGPALWLVEKGGAKLYVVGSAPPLPHQLKWDSPRLNRAMVSAYASIFSAIGALGGVDLGAFGLGGLFSQASVIWGDLDGDANSDFAVLVSGSGLSTSGWLL